MVTTRAAAQSGSPEVLPFAERKDFSNVVQIREPASPRVHDTGVEDLALARGRGHLLQAQPQRLVDHRLQVRSPRRAHALEERGDIIVEGESRSHTSEHGAKMR